MQCQRILAARHVAQPLQERQRGPGGQRQVELGGQVPPAQVGSVIRSLCAAALDQQGQKCAGHGQVGAQRRARQHADHGKCRHLPALQRGRPAKAGHRQQHAGQPRPLQPEAAHHPQPTGHGQRTADEIQHQEQRNLRRRSLQPILGEEQHQRGWYGAGDAIAQEHRQQTAEGRLGQRQPKLAIARLPSLMPLLRRG
ncbi:hypothetical protein SDC9_173256 [bioreactor metagenome]|uniref:Uncharacterized protein n=1 Tax=bioreactor metagenome TaxID=1076179 RepID=A0A645GI44_9ZZZZ